MPGSEAEKKFWRNPELVEGLLHFLDPPSILQLGQAHPLATGILQRTYVWSRFIRHSCPHPTPKPLRFEERTEQLVAEMRPIIGILQLIGSHQFHVMLILDTICERFQGLRSRSRDNGGRCKEPEFVKVICPNHEVHYVSPVGFMLLELVEDANHSSEQKVELVNIGHMKGPLISALKSRTMRQEVAMSRVDCNAFLCTTQDDAEALLSLVQRAEVVKFQRLAILGAIGEGGWAALVEALRLLPPLPLDPWNMEAPGPLQPTGFQALVVRTSNLMLDGRREDVRAVWDALPEGSQVLMNFPNDAGRIFHKVSEEDWVRLEQYLNQEDAVEAQNELPEK